MAEHSGAANVGQAFGDKLVGAGDNGRICYALKPANAQDFISDGVEPNGDEK